MLVEWAPCKALLVVGTTASAARLVVPRVLAWVDASRSREVFLLPVLGLCIGTARLTSRAGLSLVLGALLGGMVVVGTGSGHRAMSDVLPLRDAFVSVLSVSIGMLFDARVVLGHPIVVLVLLGGLLPGKALLATLPALVMRFPERVALRSGAGLAQFGESGFVLARLGVHSGIVDEESLRPLLAAGIASMFLTPVLVGPLPHCDAGERLLAPLERLVDVRA